MYCYMHNRNSFTTAREGSAADNPKAIRSSPFLSERFGTPAPSAQPLEPILFPKLRIYFADFPYLHCSINQRLFTLETCCGYEYDLA